MKINIFWFRRDLRLNDNTALEHALSSGIPVLPVFIFDTNIINELPSKDPRITFIYESLAKINLELNSYGSSIYVLKDEPESAWKKMTASFEINEVFVNKDYEPYSINRDKHIESILDKHGITFRKFKDQVLFEENEIVKSDGKPYTVFTPYKKKWLRIFTSEKPEIKKKINIPVSNFIKRISLFPSINDLGFTAGGLKVKPYNLSVINKYHRHRDFPAQEKTSNLSPHLRFGTVSIRDIVTVSIEQNPVFLSELIWREFFMQILFHFPNVITDNFKRKYDGIIWRNNEKEFDRWCNGETGYPLVDAGMRELNETGYMHNRIRMITAGFLCKHLLIDWRWGEAYFAGKLIDFELSSNNGNWQWASGTGCDAAPYFRVFNPLRQQQKFDPHNIYIKKWVPELGTAAYPEPVVDHSMARDRAISTYRNGIKS